MEEINERKDTMSWAAFIGCMFVGMGIGMLYDQPGVGTLLGMGAGYIAEAIIESTKKQISR